ncbi:hypothetical protein E1B28_011549 [Marasmius oreades]|uniref:26S proteasome complex subunit SEM1 n=1 Tax=Marasmius oreades TaxID=181124 RepID=A0A9P7RVE4_9AGAR|nr:uncharacterized protein E1B28_011549 [Marasmius oreades]KAG7089916.1 hypothetical protein E1B28_011549 [Marasmius oreades]
MSSSTSTSKPKTEGKAPSKSEEKQEARPHLGVLEEDDEFEEFPAADWDDSQTDMGALVGGSQAPGAAKSGADKLWEDNWDDDDIEEDFSVQLRQELAKTGKGSDAMES